MPTSKKPPKQTLRSWHISILRSRAHYLGTVDARNEQAAEAVAVAQSMLDDQQRKRLVVREESEAT